MPTDEPVTVDVIWGPYTKTDVGRSGLSVVLAEFSDGSIEFVMSYVNELALNPEVFQDLIFGPEDFLGKTRQEIRVMYLDLETYLYRCKSKVLTALYI